MEKLLSSPSGDPRIFQNYTSLSIVFEWTNSARIFTLPTHYTLLSRRPRENRTTLDCLLGLTLTENWLKRWNWREKAGLRTEQCAACHFAQVQTHETKYSVPLWTKVLVTNMIYSWKWMKMTMKYPFWELDVQDQTASSDRKTKRINTYRRRHWWLHVKRDALSTQNVPNCDRSMWCIWKDYTLLNPASVY